MTDVMLTALAHFDLRAAEGAKKKAVSAFDLRRTIVDKAHFSATNAGRVASTAGRGMARCKGVPCLLIPRGLCVVMAVTGALTTWRTWAGSFRSVPFLAVTASEHTTVLDAMLLLGQFGQRRLFVVRGVAGGRSPTTALLRCTIFVDARLPVVPATWIFSSH